MSEMHTFKGHVVRVERTGNGTAAYLTVAGVGGGNDVEHRIGVHSSLAREAFGRDMEITVTLADEETS